MKSALPDWLATLTPRLAALVTSSVVSGWLLAAVAATQLLTLATPADAADCSISGSGTSTFTYTAATINSAAEIDFPGTMTCTASHDGLDLCLGSIYSPTVVSGSSSMPLAVGFNDTTQGKSVSPMNTTGSMYGPYGPGGLGASTTNVTIAAIVPAGSTAQMPAGTYTSTFPIHFNMTSNQTGCDSYTNTGIDSAFTNYSVNYVIPPLCTLQTPPAVNFGNVSSIGATAAAIYATGTIQLTCNSAYTVYIGDGNNRVSPGSGLRRMAQGAALLPYQLYQDPNHTQVWDNTGGPGVTGGSGGYSGTGTGSALSLTVYGAIPAGTTLPGTVGTYTDTVVVTVAY